MLYLVTDYVPYTLQSVVEREEFTPADLLWFMRQVIRATAFMHSRGVAHRDLKASRRGNLDEHAWESLNVSKQLLLF